MARAVLGMVLAALLAAIAVVGVAESRAPSASTSKSTTRIGAMVARAQNLRVRIQAAKDLGVRYVRPAAAEVNDPDRSKAIDDTRAAGLRIVLTVVNRPAGPGRPSTPPKDMNAYRAALGRTLDRYRPALAAIENEEMAPKFYAGSPKQYLTQLKAAVKVAHKRRLKVTNGGIVSTGVTLATWYDLWRRDRRAQADAYARRTFPASRAGSRVLKDIPNQDAPARPILAKNARLAAALRITRQLLAGYRKTGIDYINFHWYQSPAKSLRQSVRFLERVVGRPAVSNEMGQFDRSPSTVVSLLKESVALRLPYVVWFAGDGDPAVGLVDRDGTLRENGRAFRDYVRTRSR